MYIEDDLDAGATPSTRLCDVCAEDREATHTCLQCQQRYCLPCRRVHDSISSCRSHTVVPLQPDSQGDGHPKGDVPVKQREESCLKHPNQPVILFCNVCKSSICMQCKLTSHEGHATEDLADAGAKVKARLQVLLETATRQTRSLEGVLAAIGDKRSKMLSLQERSEQGIRDRADRARHWVDGCRDKALESLQALTEGVTDKLSAAAEHVQHKMAALTAQSDHVTRVLRDDKDADIVALQAQLTDVAVEEADVAQLLDDLGGEAEPYRCEHNPVAVSAVHLQEYVGVLTRSAPKNVGSRLASGDEPSHAATARLPLSAPSTVSAAPMTAQQSSRWSAVHTQPSHAATARLPLSAPSTVSTAVPSRKPVTVSEVVYSRNPNSKISAMCTTSEKRAWIKYKPSGQGEIMGLYNKDGLLRNEDNPVPGDSIVTVLDDVTLGYSGYVGECGSYQPKCSWIQTGEGSGSATTPFLISSFSKCSNKNLFASLSEANNTRSVCHCSVTSLNPLAWENTVIIKVNYVNTSTSTSLIDLQDVCMSEKHFAFQGRGVNYAILHLYMKDKSDGLRLISTYRRDKQDILDACFFPVDGQEMLLVAVKGDDRVHVVDHTDGCHLVRYLDTGPVSLCSPCRLATDHERVLWIGCHGGKAVLLEF